MVLKITLLLLNKLIKLTEKIMLFSKEEGTNTHKAKICYLRTF